MQAPTHVPAHALLIHVLHALAHQRLNLGLVLEVGGGEAALREDALGEAPVTFDGIEGAAVSAVEDEFHVLLLAVRPHHLGLVDAQVVHQDVQAQVMLHGLPQLRDEVGEVVLIQRLGHQLGVLHLPAHGYGPAYGHGFEADLVAGRLQHDDALGRPHLALRLLATPYGFVREE